MICVIEGCTRKHHALGWCQTHYRRYWKTGTTDLRPLGEPPSYQAAQKRVISLWGQAYTYPCATCGETARGWVYDGTDPGAKDAMIASSHPVKYSVWPEFYKPLCYPCHRLEYRRKRSLARTHCKNGHELAEENTYSRKDKWTRECRTCRAEDNRVRSLKKKGHREDRI